MPKDKKLIIAILTIAIVWGTTYLTIKIAVETIPPWFVTGIRQSIASLILIVYLFYKKRLKWIGWKNVRTQVILGTLMLILANGLTTIAEKYVSSSLTSLILSSSPIVVFLGSVLLGFEKFTAKSVLGLALGFTGVLMIFWDGLQDLLNPDFRFGIMLIFIGIFSWASATLYSKTLANKNEEQDILLNMLYQFGWSAIVQMIFAFAFSDNYNFGNWSLASILCVVYLGIFGSVITFNAFFYALKKVNPSQISMLNYVNTIIAIFLGWLVLDEKITWKFLMAAVFIIAGVFVMNYKKGMVGFKK